MRVDYHFHDEERVAFDNGVIKGFGVIVGAATAPMPVLGVGYMVRVEEASIKIPNEEYPFNTIIVHEIHLKRHYDSKIVNNKIFSTSNDTGVSLPIGRTVH